MRLPCRVALAAALALTPAMALAAVTSGVVSPASPPSAAAQVIAGLPLIGQTLRVSPLAGAAYQWTRSGYGPIPGATSSSYTLVSADGGKLVACSVTLAGVTVTTGTVLVGALDFSSPMNSALIGALQ